MLPFGQMLAVGVQHVLVMYAGAIAVPLLMGGVLRMPKDQVALLISSDLFSCGVVTLMQCIDIWKFGNKLPVIMGVSFAPVGAMIAIANGGAGIQGILGDITGVRSRWVVAVSGVILFLLGLLPKISTIVASIPQAVLGGAGIAMFGMVAATGVKILSKVDYESKNNLLIVAVSFGMGMIPLVSPNFFQHFPAWSSPITHSGITLTAITAILLNALFNRAESVEEVERELAADAAFPLDSPGKA